MMRKEFHSELRSLQIHLTGSQITTFNDNKALRNRFQHQYPRWKDAGIVTSIPAGRLPQLFLNGDQTTASFEKRMNSLQKGESGEIDVYTSLLSTKGLKDGLLVLPNVDGNFFRSEVAHVELDIVVVHPRKGAFIFNVKNAKNAKESMLCADMVKHSKFIQLLQSFGGEDSIVPVHGVICSLEKTLSPSALKAGGYYDSAIPNGMRFVIQPNEIKDFSKSWLSILSEVPDLSENQFHHVEDLAITLGSLNSIEGAVAMVHKQVTTNNIQTIQRKVRDGEKILADSIAESIAAESSTLEGQNMDALRKELIALQTSETKGEKMSFILWTLEQQRIISHVGLSLLQRSSKPCRMIVTGPKGSGKTMLMVFLAHLATKIFKSDGISNSVVINDGRGASQLLFEKLKSDFKGTDITVDTSNWWLDSTRSPMLDKKLLLFDECILGKIDHILNSIQEGQHAILFSSLRPEILKKESKKIGSSYTILELTNSLRSTSEVMDFVESFRTLDKQTGECQMKASHNLRGVMPHIQSITLDHNSDPLHKGYIEAVVSEIGQAVHQCHDLENILVTPFVHQVTLERIISEIQKNGWNYQYRNPEDYAAKLSMFDVRIKEQNEIDKTPNTTVGPQISLSTGNHVDGTEYGVVILLLEQSLPVHWDVLIHPCLYIAMTRTTTLLSIIVNDTATPPLIHQKEPFSNKEGIPKWFEMVEPVVDVDISAYAYIECRPDQMYCCLERIVEDSFWSKAPVLVLGDHKCLSRFDEIEQPPDVFVDARYVVDDEIRWFQTGSKTIVNTRKYSSSHLFFDGRIYYDFLVNGFSALVFLVSSPETYAMMLVDSRRHQLMYRMHEEYLGYCPIYTLTSCPHNHIRPHLSIKSICDFLKSCYMEEEDSVSHCAFKPSKSTVEPLIQSWREVKKLGNNLFKDGDLEAALQKYTESIKKLKAEFYSSLQKLEIGLLIQLKDEQAKLCTNISKTYYDLAKSVKTGLDVLKMELSLQYAERSVKLDPFWYKGHHRVFEAKLMLREECCAKALDRQKTSISKLNSSELYDKKRLMILDEKMKRSNAWELLRFKGNAFLVDKNNQGHFESIGDALNHQVRTERKPISILINAGVYEESIMIKGNTVDLVGNVQPDVCKKNQWILEDPLIVIQSKTIGPSFSNSSVVFLSRLSIFNWKHAAFAFASSLSLYQCAFKSTHGAAVVATGGSTLNVQACRFVDTYGAVLAADHNKVMISHTLVQKAKVMGLEFRDNTSIHVESCTVCQCESQGIGNVRGDILIKSCLFEANSSKLTIDEGSIQVDQCNATVQNCKVINQIGNGIVIQYGKGTFHNVTVDRCKHSGFLIQAPCTITGCRVNNCVNGFTICDNINGDVILEDCTVSCCKKQVSRLLNAIKPIIRGNLECNSNDIWEEFKDDRSSNRPPSLTLGRMAHERSLKLREYLADEGNVIGPRFIGNRGCAYCCAMPVPYLTKSRYFLCEDCNDGLYCSHLCSEKNKEIHSVHCDSTKKNIDAYRESIGWKGFSGERKEGDMGFDEAQASENNDGNEGFLRKEDCTKGKKYRGLGDLDEPYLTEYCLDNLKHALLNPQLSRSFIKSLSTRFSNSEVEGNDEVTNNILADHVKQTASCDVENAGESNVGGSKSRNKSIKQKKRHKKKKQK